MILIEKHNPGERMYKVSQQQLTGNYWVLKRKWYGYETIAMLPPGDMARETALAVCNMWNKAEATHGGRE